ncbi:hypothetical protein BZL39_G02440 [Zygosaccharomyces parabailii]|nr:hypothetical protein BZL39_G02440 [Zygosaccharomyces parabailii]
MVDQPALFFFALENPQMSNGYVKFTYALWKRKQALYNFSVNWRRRSPVHRIQASRKKHALYIENTPRRTLLAMDTRARELHLSVTPVRFLYICCVICILKHFYRLSQVLLSGTSPSLHYALLKSCLKKVMASQRNVTLCLMLVRIEHNGFLPAGKVILPAGPMQLLRAFQTHETYFMTAFV